MNEQYVPLLEGTVEIVVKCYAAVHHSKLLDTAAQVGGGGGRLFQWVAQVEGGADGSSGYFRWRGGGGADYSRGVALGSS